jgi:hypothetical protein
MISFRSKVAQRMSCGAISVIQEERHREQTSALKTIFLFQSNTHCLTLFKVTPDP